MRNNSGAGVPGLLTNTKDNNMTKFTIYLFGYKPAQTITTRTIDGENWYMAADICRLLGISNHSLAVQKHLDEDEQLKTTIYIGGRHGKKHVLMINNSGMLKLVNVAQDDRVPLVKQRARIIPENCLPEDQQHLRLAA
jgi:prophage antirepressor-like protein